MSNIAFDNLNVTNRNAKVAILATVAFESQDFEFCKNLKHPDTQGAYSQISLQNLIEYGAFLNPPMKASSDKATSDEPFIQRMCDNKQIAYQSGTWYYQLSPNFNQSVRDAVETEGSSAAYTNYVVKALFTNITDTRTAKWQLVNDAVTESVGV
jgi:hypothetical protein